MTRLTHDGLPYDPVYLEGPEVVIYDSRQPIHQVRRYWIEKDEGEPVEAVSADSMIWG